MSSLDSQMLSAGAMFSASKKRVVRWPLGLFILFCYFLSLFVSDGIFQLGIWSLSGFAALTPLLYICLRQEKVNAQGLKGALVLILLLWLGFYWRSTFETGGYTIMGTGMMPVVPLVVLSMLCCLGLFLTEKKAVKRVEEAQV